MRGSSWSSGWTLAVRLAAASSVVALAGAGLVGPSAGAEAAPQALVASPSAASNWSSYLDGPAHSSFNAAATAISPTDVANLDPVWTGLKSAGFQASPTVVDGIVYIGSENGTFYAFDEATRSVLWTQSLGTVKGTTCGSGQQGIISTATVVTDPATEKLTVYVNAPNGYLYTLDAATGAVDWRGLVGIPSTTVNNYYAWGSPLVANGDVYIGIASECDVPLVPAGLLSFNQSTGAQVAWWHPLPGEPPGTIGGSIWSTPAALADGAIIATTGNDQGTLQNLYADSMVRLTPAALTLTSGWQIPLDQQVHDSDFGGSPTLFTADIGGKKTNLVGACNKDGYYYAMRQDDIAAGPVWEDEITVPFAQGSVGECDAAAVWNGTDLIEGGGAATTIDGTPYPGSVQALDPATGAPVWQTGLPGVVIGSPSEDGAGVVAAPVYYSPTGASGVYLLNAQTGAILSYIPTKAQFGQAVFDGDEMLVAGASGGGLTSYQITTPGPAVTAVAPDTVAAGTTTATLTITGSGFTGTPSLSFPGRPIAVTSLKVVSSTELRAKVSVAADTPTGPAPLVVVEPGPVADTCTDCLSVTAAP